MATPITVARDAYCASNSCFETGIMATNKRLDTGKSPRSTTTTSSRSGVGVIAIPAAFTA